MTLAGLLRALVASPPPAAPVEPVRSAEAPGDPAAYELAYREATRALEVQGASLESLRSRAGMILSAAAVIAGFLGPAAVPASPVPWLPPLGGVLFLTAAGICISLLLPIAEWHNVTGTRNLLADYIEAEAPASMAEIHRSLAYHMETDWDRNEERLVRRSRLLALAGALATAETAVWLVALAM